MTNDQHSGASSIPPYDVGGLVGQRIITTSWIATAVFAATSVAASITLGVLRWPALVVALAMFGSGCVVFLWAFAVAVGRSRTDSIGIGGLFFLAGTSPTGVQWQLLGALAVQLMVAITTASVRTFTTLAFGALAPVFGLAMSGLWGAKFGKFGPRDPRD